MGYVDTPWAMSRDGLTANEKYLLTVMTMHANEDRGNVMWHSYKSLAYETGMSDSTVRRAAKSLEEKGLIRRKAQFMIRQGDTKPSRTSDLVTVLVGAGVEQPKRMVVEAVDNAADPLRTVDTPPTQSDKGVPSQRGEGPPTVTTQNKKKNMKKNKEGRHQRGDASEQQATSSDSDAMPFDEEEKYTAEWVHVGSDEPAF